MTVITQRRRPAQFSSPVQHQQMNKVQRQKNNQASLMVVSSLKASLVGGVGLLLLMLISLIPPPENIPFLSLAYLVWPGFVVVCLATGLLASILAGDSIRNSYQGGKVGWMAGFWAGIYGGIGAMLMAAVGIFMVSFGQGVVNQFTPSQLATWQSVGLTADTISLAGRVFGALVVYGIIGSLVCALLSSIGGMIYPKLSAVE